MQIGTEMSRLGRQERMCIPSSIFMDSRPLIGDDAKHINVLQLSMPHLFAFPSDNSASVELIMDKLFRSLEASDNATGIGVVSDFCSGLGSSLSSALVSEIKDCLPHLQLTCAMALPPESTIHGIGALNGLMGVQTALQYADAVMLRSLDDAMAMVEEAASASVPSTLQQANMLIACDLYCALGPKSVCSNSDYEELMHDNSVFSTQQIELDWESVAGLYCWPANVCSTTNKLCDVRTSLWRLHLRNQHLASKTKGAHISAASLAKTENYNPLRALAANMHTLHVTAGERPVLHSELLLHKSISSVVKAASLGCFTFEDTSDAGVRCPPTPSGARY